MTVDKSFTLIVPLLQPVAAACCFLFLLRSSPVAPSALHMYVGITVGFAVAVAAVVAASVAAADSPKTCVDGCKCKTHAANVVLMTPSQLIRTYPCPRFADRNFACGSTWSMERAGNILG